MSEHASDLLVLYGGTFDPVHEGHLSIARATRDALATTVHFMPANDPPHRAAPGANALHRARMLDIAIAGEPGLVVDRRELSRDGRSYSIDTLRALRADIGAQRPVALLLGADSFLSLPTWKAWEALFDLAHLIVAERPGSGIDEAMAPELAQIAVPRMANDAGALLATPAGCIWRLRQPLVDASASEVRARIANGGAWMQLVPSPVAAYIARHRLYAGGGAA